LEPPGKGAWSNGVVEEWYGIEERVLKARKPVPIRFPMDRAWIDICSDGFQYSNHPILHYSVQKKEP
jgi:hypothetical protein